MTGTDAATTPVHGVQAHPGGCMRRMISLDNRGPSIVVGWLEDHFHHFGATVVHDGRVVTDVRTASPRHPWVTCPGTIVPLRALIGKPPITRASDLGGLIDMRQLCTHVFDLVSLLLVQAATGRPDRTYEAIISDRAVRHNPMAQSAGDKHVFGGGSAALLLDGTEVMRWELDDREIVGGPPYAGHTLELGFRLWTEAMPEAEAEYATILRRAILVAYGRNEDMDAYRAASDQKMPPVCYAFQLERASVGYAARGNQRNYEASNAGMLQHRSATP